MPPGFTRRAALSSETRLQRGQRGDVLRPLQVQDVGVPADGPGRRAGGVEQHRVEQLARRPGRGIGLDDIGLKLQPLEVGAQAGEPARVRLLDRRHVSARRGEFGRLAAGRRAQIGDRSAGDVAKQASGDRRGGILHPPCTLRVTGEVLDASAGGEPHRARRQRSPAQPLGP